jgi:microcystin degradation protein MlrC
MTRIFVAGFQHETNTFAPSKADWSAFEAATGFAAYARGDAMLEQLGTGDLPIGGFVREAGRRGWQLLPSLWAGATPSAQVTQAAFERIRRELIEDLQAAVRMGPVDAVYLDLHGAAVAEHVDDCEGELLAEVRQRVGATCPIVASLDLHANVSHRMLGQANALVAYRTYPHIDTAGTGERAARWLARLLGGERWHSAMQRLPFLLPLNAQCTFAEPAAGLYRLLSDLEAQHGVHLSFCMGFPASDISDCAASVTGHGADAETVQIAVRALADAATQQRSAWRLDLMPPALAVEQAAVAIGAGASPVVIADTQDNPGAGGDSNTTGMLHALLAAGAGQRWPGGVALALLWDPVAARQAHDLGVGAEAAFSLGRPVVCFDGRLSDAAWQGQARVVALHDGRVQLDGPMRGSGHTQLGPCARLDVQGVQVLVSSLKCQVLDLALLQFLGIEPGEMALIVVKSSVHFRAAFLPVAKTVLVAQAHGPMAANPADLPWTRLPEQRARTP